MKNKKFSTTYVVIFSPQDGKVLGVGPEIAYLDQKDKLEIDSNLAESIIKNEINIHDCFVDVKNKKLIIKTPKNDALFSVATKKLIPGPDEFQKTVTTELVPIKIPESVIHSSPGRFSLINSIESIEINDVNLKPDWISHQAEYTEFFIKRKKRDLLVVIGESWTYGESLPGIATAVQKYNFGSQLTNCFGSRMAVALDCDLYQYAVPGNCNLYMVSEFERIIEYVTKLKYRKIYVCLQVTEPGRELNISSKLHNTIFRELYNRTHSINFLDWLVLYDNVLFKEYNRILEKYKHKIIDTVLWKNFCDICTPRRDFNFKIVDTTWIQYSGKLFGYELPAPRFYSVGWLADLRKNYKDVITFDSKFCNDQMNLIERINEDYLKGHCMHYPHPNELLHFLWAQFLIRKAGWRNDI